MKAPSFWSHKTPLSTALLPLSFLYQIASKWRMKRTRPYQSKIAVICVGNLTSGGTGKTPVCAALAAIAKENGLKPVILSRGYGGSLAGPVLLELDKYDAKQTGDEPRLLAQSAPIVIAHNRTDGARFIESKLDCDVIIMDDGLQNPQLEKDIKIGVFDGEIGIQNGRIFPAGPLRTSLNDGQKMLDIILINGVDKHHVADLMKPISAFSFDLAPQKIPQKTKSLKTKNLIAFAGIGRPKRFFDMLAKQGYKLVQHYDFGDHHAYSEAELSRLLDEAKATGAQLVTTEKDWVRLAPSWQKLIDYYPVQLAMNKTDKTKLVNQIFEKLKS